MIRRLITAAVVLSGLAIGAAAFWVTTPFALFEKRTFIDVPKGAGTRGIARALTEAGVIQSPYQFYLIRVIRPAVRLKAGEYAFDKPAAAWEVFARIARGDVFYYPLSAPEGNNIFDIAGSLERAKIMPSQEFVQAAHDPRLIRDMDPAAPSLEGYLYPDTYHVNRHTTAQQLCRMMTSRFRKAWQQLGPPNASVHDTITLASMVEKEARLPGERALIASVFRNRLRLTMPLQCDPTTIYAAQLEDRYHGVIHRSDLTSQQRYNTYQHAGLPPGPIANPGMNSIQAALSPAQSDYLYFVLKPDGSGEHQFSKALADHDRAVQEYRRGQRQAQQANGSGRVPGAKPARAGRGT